MARPARPERSKSARSSRQLSRFYHSINPDRVFGTHRDKIMRMAAQTAPIEAGAVHLPARAPWVEEFKKEILSFPASKHDDQIDALSQALQRAFAPDPPVTVFGTYGRGS